MHDGMASHLHIVHCQSLYPTHLPMTIPAFYAGLKPTRIATNYSAAACTSPHLSFANLQLNSAVFLGSPDPFTATSCPSPHISKIPHCRPPSAPSHSRLKHRTRLASFMPCSERPVSSSRLAIEHAVA